MIRFSPGGRIFVGEKSGLIKVFDDLSDTSPTVLTNVQNFWDRGLLGLALPPNFPTVPYVYVLYNGADDRSKEGNPAHAPQLLVTLE